MSGSDAGTSMIPALVQTIFREALEQGVAEIHAEPRPEKGVIRFREHGVLREHTSLNPLTYSDFVNHMKALCAEQMVPDDPRLPQTGRLSLMIDGSTDGPLEISLQTLPVHGGEKLLLRILQADSRDWTLDDLGFSAANLALYREAIARPTGMIIHAGPTGSGKTTSLYAAVGALDLARKSATSVEWALERFIPDLNQHVVDRENGGSFADSLRSIMRQSPDIVLVGKLEDIEAVELALGLAASALVFGSIHTSDGASTLTRFTDMGMESFLVS
ncbi:MAG: ATPase, T2SS/T4P/T4SS family, partial [Planctomycetota bacterium]|nr:ATPase, T2SS/T4P/T4SS family [Planctomycetota bacterium]